MEALDSPRTTLTTPRPSDAPAPRPRRRLAVPPLAIVLLLSLAVRVALWAAYVAPGDPAALLGEDGGTYHLSAQALLHTRTFSVSPQPPLVPQTVRTPGYPAFIAAVYAIFGDRPAAAVLVQAMLSVGTIALAYALARRLWGERVALLAAGLFALAIGPLQFSLLLMSETLFSLLLVCAAICGIALLARSSTAMRPTPVAPSAETEDALRFDRRAGAPAMGTVPTRPALVSTSHETEGPLRLDRRWWALALGMALAACAFVRPAAYYLVVPIALGVAIHGWRARWGMREMGWVMAMLLVPYIAAVGGWQYRNLRLTGSSAFSQVSGEVLLRYRGAAIIAMRDGIRLDEARARLAAEYPADPNRPPTTEETARWRRAGIALIRENPGIYARVILLGMARTLVVPATISPPAASAQPEPGWRAEVRQRGVWSALRARMERRGLLGSATFAFDALRLVMVLAAAGWFVAGLVVRRRMEMADAFLLGIALYLLLVHAGPTAGVRSRVQLEPILALYAARGLAALWRSRRIAEDHETAERGVAQPSDSVAPTPSVVSVASVRSLP